MVFKTARAFVGLLSTVAFLAACSSDSGGGGGFNFLDSPTNGLAECSVTTSSPSVASVKVSAVGGTLNTFSVGTSASSCVTAFTLNGAPIVSTGGAVSVDSAILNAGNNTLVATSGKTNKTWTIVKNNAPTCSSQTPASSGNSSSPGTTTILTGFAADSDSDPISFNWNVNNSSVPGSVLNVFNGSTSSQATFTPTTAYLGSNLVSMVISDGIDTSTCSWSVGVAGTCSITATSPAAPGTSRVPFNAAATTLFQATANPGCTYTWRVNGSVVAGVSTGNYNIPSSGLLVGANVVDVAVTNGTSTDTKTWTVVRNTPPTCSSQIPGSTPASTVGVGSGINLTGNGSDFNGDPLTFTWKNNGTPVNTSIFTVVNNINSSQATFAPDAGYVGTNNVLAEINDGYDTSSCQWTVNVVPTCTIATATPAGATLKMPFAPGATQNYVAVPNDASCALVWTLNGNAIAGTTAINSISSSQLNAAPAANTLVATASNGFTTATRTWTITKNQVPTCSSQTPASSGNSVGVGGNISLTGVSGNPDSDTHSYSWTSNGNAANPTYFSINSITNTSNAVFTPNASFVGSNSIGVTINDGYDSAHCDWNVNVINNCAVSASLPSTSTTRIANAGATNNAFFVVPSDSACTITWTLNGSPVPGSQFINLPSSGFANAPGSNTVVATLDNGVTTPTTRTWTVTKNRVPTCSSQSPISNPAPLAYGQTQSMTAVAGDPDGDALQDFVWRFQGATSSTLFTPINTNVGTGTSVTTFRPTVSEAGLAKVITTSFSDGFDGGSCSWTQDISNPNTVSIISCVPSANPIVVYSTGPQSTQVLTTTASNASTYEWYKNGTLQGAYTNATFSAASSSLPVGNYTFRNIVYDLFNNSAFCDYTVKVNAAPAITSALPTTGQTYRVNYGSTLGLSVTATDGNSDGLSYNWTLDGMAHVSLPSGTASTVFTPNYTTSLIGSHTITVTVSDGAESTSQSWPIEVNYFSDPCNNLMNSSVATAGGNICTLVGVPGMGNNFDPTLDQTLVRVRPNYVIDDGFGNLYVTDLLNHAVIFYNRSGAPITRFGKTTAAGKMTVLMGNGAQGLTQDNLYNTAFKLNSPYGIAYDHAAQRLYVSDYTNHRVAMMDNTGYVTTIFGTTGAAANSTATNGEGVIGTSQSCNNPAGLKLMGTGANRWLYIACANQNSIKRMNADTASVDFGKGYMVVGRLNASGQNTASYADGTPGPTGDAMTTQPWVITDDAAGNIYWSEQNGYRIRMLNLTGSDITFFDGQPSTSTAFGVNAGVTDGSLTVINVNIQAMNAAGPITKLLMSGVSSLVTNTCTPVKVYAANASNQEVVVGADTSVAISGMAGGAGIYTNDTCTTPVPGSTVTIANGTSGSTFFYKNTGAAAITLTATGGGYTNGTLAVTTVAAGVATKLAMFMPTAYQYQNCHRIIVQAQNGSNVASTLGTAKTIRMSTESTGTFYANPTCTGTPSFTFPLNAGVSQISVYYSRAIVAPAGQVISVLGNQGSNTISPTTSASISHGLTTLRNPRGLAVFSTGSTVHGFAVSAYDQHRNIFANNTTSPIVIGGTTVAPLSTAVFLGTGTGGFNTDGLGNLTRVFTNFGLSLNHNKTQLLFADYDNYRVRSLDVSIGNGYVSTLLGAGRARSGHLGDSPNPAPAMYLNSPSGIAVDNTNRKLYVTDSGNARIRRVDLLTGAVDTMIGKGAGAAAIENEDPTNTFMTSPRAITLMSNSGGTPFLVYTDQAANTAMNSNCQIRALNLTPNVASPPPATFFNQVINAFKVSTIAGDYGLGCQAWNTAPTNVSGGPATGNKLYNPEGLASDGTNLYVSLYNDHCIAKLTPNGNMTVIVGTCGTAGVTDGSTALATIRFPTAIVVDPVYAADGNFFFADAIDSTPTRIRYVNYRTTSVQIGSQTVPAATSPNGIVQTIWTASASGNSNGRIYGLAAFGSQMCIAGGEPNNGHSGVHNVTCYDRASPVGPVTLRVGPNELSNPPTRAGAPLDDSQEGIYAGSALLNAPYGLSFDSSGNLYISERNNHIVRMVRRWW